MKEKLLELIKNACETENISIDEISLEKPKNSENGDYSTNVALKLAGTLKKNPMDVADMLSKHLKASYIKKIDVVKPGFINFYLDNAYLVENIDKVLKLDKDYGRSTMGNGEKVNVEFVSANPTGIMHLGNARGGAYGDSLARILNFAGYKATKEYYVNDAGNQIDNLGLSIKARYAQICGQEAEIPENGYHGPEISTIAENIYKENKESKLDADLDYFKNLGIDYLLGQIKQDLHDYRIDFDVFSSEKAIREKYDLDEIIDKLDKNGYIYTKDDAKWFKCSALYDDKDHVLKKSDGSFTYFTPDIAYHYDKFKRGFTHVIDVLGTDHHGYVARLKSSVKALGNDADALDVKLLQLVRLVDNNEVVKMSKRAGKVVTLRELMDEIGVNAARYYFSKYSLDTQMDFDLNLAKKNSSENPVYYVSYAYARICSILNKYNKDTNVTEYLTLNNDDAYDILEKVYAFPEVVENAAKKELPHLITNYVYSLAQSFHEYYDKVRIISDDEEATQENINLLKAVKITLANALDLIGIIPPESM
jgi:arginyl-tRNA synthetase